MVILRTHLDRKTKVQFSIFRYRVVYHHRLHNPAKPRHYHLPPTNHSVSNTKPLGGPHYNPQKRQDPNSFWPQSAQPGNSCSHQVTDRQPSPNLPSTLLRPSLGIQLPGRHLHTGILLSRGPVRFAHRQPTAGTVSPLALPSVLFIFSHQPCSPQHARPPPWPFEVRPATNRSRAITYIRIGKLTQLPVLAKPMTAMVPFRAAAALSTSSKRDATSLTPHSGATGLARARKEVPLASQEGTKGVIQYALYVTIDTQPSSLGQTTNTAKRSNPLSIESLPLPPIASIERNE